MSKIFSAEQLKKENNKINKHRISKKLLKKGNEGKSYKIESLGHPYHFGKYGNYVAYVNFDGEIELIPKDEIKRHKKIALADYNEKKHRLSVKDKREAKKIDTEAKLKEALEDPLQFKDILQGLRDGYLKGVDDLNKFLARTDVEMGEEEIYIKDPNDSKKKLAQKAFARNLDYKNEKNRKDLYQLSVINSDIFDNDSELDVTLDILQPRKVDPIEQERYQKKLEIEKEGAETKYIHPETGEEKTGVNLMGQKVVQSLDDPEKNLELIKTTSAKNPLKDYKKLTDDELFKLLSK